MRPSSCRSTAAPTASTSTRDTMARSEALSDWPPQIGTGPRTVTPSKCEAAPVAFQFRSYHLRRECPVLTTSGDLSEPRDYALMPAPPLPPTITTLFGSIKRNGRFSVPRELQLKTAFGELKLDLREALFPDKHVLMVAETLCASV